MSALNIAGGISGPEHPSKRRRVDDDSIDSTPRDGSPDPLQGHHLSIRRGRPQSLSGSRSPRASRLDGDDGGNQSRSPTPLSPRGSRSGSRDSSRTARRARRYSRSGSGSPSASRSHSPTSRSRRSRSRRSRSRRSRSHPNSSSASRSRSRSSSSSSNRSLGSQAQQTPRLSDTELAPGPSTQRTHLTPNYRRKLALRGHTAAISQVRISPDGRWIASASADGTAKIWDAQTGEHLDTLVGHMAGVSCLAWAPDSNTLATGSDDKAIRLWERVTANPAHECADGGRTLVANGAGRGGKLRTETRGGTTGRGPLLGHQNYVYCLAFSPKGNMLASGSYDEAVFLWDVRAGRLMRSLPAHSDPVSGIDFCRDGTLVVSCSTDGLIRVWDTSTGQCLRTLVHEDNPPVTNVCFSPNGRFILAFNLDNSIRLWDYVGGAVKKTYQGHNNKGYSIGGSFSLLAEEYEEAIDGNDADSGPRIQPFVASASEDGDIVLWDVKTKSIVQRIPGAHKGVCFWVDVNGGLMVSAGQDRVINVFRQASALPNGRGKLQPPELEGETPNLAAAADDELQRQIQEEAGSPLRHVKEELA